MAGPDPAIQLLPAPFAGWPARGPEGWVNRKRMIDCLSGGGEDVGKGCRVGIAAGDNHRNGLAACRQASGEDGRKRHRTTGLDDDLEGLEGKAHGRLDLVIARRQTALEAIAIDGKRELARLRRQERVADR